MQLVDYDSGCGGDEPALVVAVDGAVERRPLESGQELQFRLGRRHCVGVVDGGDHESCDSEVAPRCLTHEDPWPCARCTGTCGKPIAACHEEHVVYLAAFAPRTFKVGVTRSWRVETRLCEQGADRGAVIRIVSDGRNARSIEADLAATVPDRVGVAPKVTALASTVDETAWERLLADHEVLERVTPDHGVRCADRPLLERTLWGTVRGVKGRLLLLEREGTTVAVDLRSVIGCDLEAGGRPPAVQSSLDTFDG